VAAGIQRDEGGDLLNGVDLRPQWKGRPRLLVIWKRTFRGYSPTAP
jgi:hypothetical protein